MSELVEGVARVIDNDLIRQAMVQADMGCDYSSPDECGVASANMNIVIDEIAQAVTAHILAEAAKVAREQASARDEQTDIAGLIERLKRKGRNTGWHVNPDGPEAATALAELSAKLVDTNVERIEVELSLSEAADRIAHLERALATPRRN